MAHTRARSLGRRSPPSGTMATAYRSWSAVERIVLARRISIPSATTRSAPFRLHVCWAPY